MFRCYGPFHHLIGVIDVGTTSVKFIVYQVKTCNVISYNERPLSINSPQEGWFEQDPMEIMNKLMFCMELAKKDLTSQQCYVTDMVAIGLTNARQTTIVWDKSNSKPLYPAILWSDTRTTGMIDKLLNERLIYPDKDHFKHITGQPISNCSSAIKIRWLIENCPEVKKAIDQDRCAFGTIDSWVAWNLIRAPFHITDPTNFSLTGLMNLEALYWSNPILDFFEIPRHTMPIIRSSSEVFGKIRVGPLNGLFICGIVGHEQGSLIGQLCLHQGMGKVTYGTGCNAIFNTGVRPCFSDRGLLTTVAFQLDTKLPAYALEASVAAIEEAQVPPDPNEASTSRRRQAAPRQVFVPTATGLYKPHWDRSGREYVTDNLRQPMVRAAKEAICFQVREIVEAVEASGLAVRKIKTDGQIIAPNPDLMQMQADLGTFPVNRAGIVENTAMGAALLALWALDMQQFTDSTNLLLGETFEPNREEEGPSREEVGVKYAAWKRVVEHLRSRPSGSRSRPSGSRD